ncbi:SDR family NAD(P)-dependent oxidoreductase [Truepera radiovictrix]|uniref:Short-chain dehydrogenase/reductase SDR n=1 Tax=Truepera radiovictrix (strain DSM 17093 / CIP 108686 / LMG 22925 / RQ-24) TaxID=649638 RepID=D7CRW9_TRURR|nr:glucose 1-dehydrogenase [Truepera radiovictrix]ADI15297.1 short-chain dehydrogenase/reductase SDR [Truepera radiovictrix DSM 17093]WMT56152.1 glucose 1-dehydrogenase [Truepera radiovictrix]
MADADERRRPLDSEFVMPSLRLDGQVALVTGGSRGLGLGVALALAHAGADLALAARTASELGTAAELVRRTGREALTLPTDVSSVAAVRGAVQRTAEHYGRLDILVNAAGINVRKPAAALSEEEWERVMAVNLKGAFFAAQAAAETMRAQGRGKIINVGSLSFEIVVPNIALYAASKGGLRQMTRALALEWAKDGICVNAIAPGRFWTAMTDAVFSDPEGYQSAVSVIPQGRPGVPADLAGAAVLLASAASDYITGQTIVVDGGWLISGGTLA